MGIKTTNVVCVCLLLFVLEFGSSLAQLKIGFYNQSCPFAEKIIKDYVNNQSSPTLAASLLRMQFHDCFVRGCDASILLNDTSNRQTAEKDTIPNRGLRFDFIDSVKTLIEAECPAVVSCADILSLVARDSVVAIGGPSWEVPTGRRDGRVSVGSEALSELPAPFFNFTQLRNSFASKGLEVKDLVVLSGAHTIGTSHCKFFTGRLYNFTGKGDPDPSLDRDYAAILETKCRKSTDNTTLVEMDPGSFKAFDLSYYKQLFQGRGLFTSDATLITDSSSIAFIDQILQGDLSNYFMEFATSMEKMVRIGVKTGSTGEIRKHCGLVN